MVVRAASKAPHPVGLSHAAAQDDHRKVRVDPGGQPVGVADAVEQLQPTAALEREVEHHEARLPHLDGPHPLPRTRRSRHAEPVRGEVLEQEGARRLVVLHNQDQPLLVHVSAGAAAQDFSPRGATCIAPGTPWEETGL